jgi:hypothetical protein
MEPFKHILPHSVRENLTISTERYLDQAQAWCCCISCTSYYSLECAKHTYSCTSTCKCPEPTHSSLPPDAHVRASAIHSKTPEDTKQMGMTKSADALLSTHPSARPVMDPSKMTYSEGSIPRSILSVSGWSADMSSGRVTTCIRSVTYARGSILVSAACRSGSC